MARWACAQNKFQSTQKCELFFWKIISSPPKVTWHYRLCSIFNDAKDWFTAHFLPDPVGYYQGSNAIFELSRLLESRFVGEPSGCSSLWGKRCPGGGTCRYSVAAAGQGSGWEAD